MCHFGARIPRFDAVFNKTASCAQSLYARARIGIVHQGSKQTKWTQIGPPTSTPDPTGSWNHPDLGPEAGQKQLNSDISSCPNRHPHRYQLLHRIYTYSAYVHIIYVYSYITHIHKEPHELRP